MHCGGTQRIRVHNILIHHPAEGEGDCGKDESTLEREPNIMWNHQQGDEQGWCSGKQVQAKFVYVITESYPHSNHCISLSQLHWQADICKCIENYKSAMALVMQGYDWDHEIVTELRW